MFPHGIKSAQVGCRPAQFTSLLPRRARRIENDQMGYELVLITLPIHKGRASRCLPSPRACCVSDLKFLVPFQTGLSRVRFADVETVSIGGNSNVNDEFLRVHRLWHRYSTGRAELGGDDQRGQFGRRPANFPFVYACHGEPGNIPLWFGAVRTNQFFTSRILWSASTAGNEAYSQRHLGRNQWL